MSKQAAGRRLYCVAHKDTLPSTIVGGIAFFVLAPKALASAQLALPDTLPAARPSQFLVNITQSSGRWLHIPQCSCQATV